MVRQIHLYNIDLPLILKYTESILRYEKQTNNALIHFQ